MTRVLGICCKVLTRSLKTERHGAFALMAGRSCEGPIVSDVYASATTRRLQQALPRCRVFIGQAVF